MRRSRIGIRSGSSRRKKALPNGTSLARSSQEYLRWSWPSWSVVRQVRWWSMP